MKGMANLVYALGLIIMLLMTLNFITPALTGSTEEPAERKLDSMVYTLRDSLDIAKLYLDTSARYSLYQAAYENALNGTFTGIDHATLLHEGKSYALWYNDEELAPDTTGITTSLKESFDDNFRKYLVGYSTEAIFTVRLPRYGDSSFYFYNDGYYTSVEIPGSDDLVITRTTTYDEEITVTKDSDILVEENFPYLRLFEEARAYHNTIKNSLADCEEDVLEAGNESFCCRITAEVVEDGDKCMVKVEAVTRDNFLVWNGEDVAFEPITLVFMDRATKA